MCFRTDTGSVPTGRPVVRLSLWFNCQCCGGARFTRASRPHVGTDPVSVRMYGPRLSECKAPVSVRIVWMAMSVCMYPSACKNKSRGDDIRCSPVRRNETMPIRSTDRIGIVFGQTRALSLQGVPPAAPHYGLTVNAVGGARAAKAGA